MLRSILKPLGALNFNDNIKVISNFKTFPCSATYGDTDGADALTQTWLTENTLNNGQEESEQSSIDCHAYIATNIQQMMGEIRLGYMSISHVLRQ